MLKIIKKSLKYLIIVAGIIFLFPTALYLLLQIPEVQTMVVRRVTNHLSNEVKSTISVGSIDFKFFNKLTLNDILIKDNNHDTLLFSKRVDAAIRRIDFKNKLARFGKVTLINPYVAFITDSSGVMNITWYLDLLKNPADTTKKSKIRISLDQIDLSDARFSLINRKGIRSKTRVDFNNMNFTGINGIIEDLKIQNDTTSFNIYNLAFKESSGFTIKKMSSTVILSNQNILFNSASINCDSSILNFTRLGLIADSSSSFKRFTDEVKLDILLDKSLINSSDLGYFVVIPDGVNESVSISGKISGTVSELRGRNISLKYKEYTSLDCDFDLSGLPKIENAFIYIGVNSLKTNAIDFEEIKTADKKLIVIPEVLYKLGNISFDGSFTGFTTDFVTYGEFRTTYGNIRTDISLRPEESKKYRIKGLVTGNDIDIGELTGKTDLLGKVSMQANVDGYAFSTNKFAANITGKIDSIEINMYKYRNIALQGFFTEKTWDGSINIQDNNIKLDLMGMFNFNKALPEFDFTLNLAEANLYKLHINKIDTTAALSMLLTSNFSGNNIDNLDGEIRLLNSTYIKNNNKLDLYDFSVKTYQDSSKPVLSLRTDIVDADIRGYYNFASIGNLIKSTLATLMPAQFKAPSVKGVSKKNNFTYSISFKNTDKINEFFMTGLLLADKSNLSGTVFTDSIITINGSAKSLSFRNSVFKDFTVAANASTSELSVDINSSDLVLLGQSDLKNFTVRLNTNPDNFIFTIDWDNKDKELNKGNFTARGTISKNLNNNKYAILNLEIDSANIYARNSLWKINRSSIRVDSTSIFLDNFYINNNEYYYRVNGTISENLSDTLYLEFKGIDISPMNYLGNQKNYNDPNKIPLNFKGKINGKVMVTNVYKNLLLESDLVVTDFSMLNSNYGNIIIRSALDNASKIVNIDASNNLDGINMFDISGNYDPYRKKIDLTAVVRKLPIDALNPLLKVFASGITGTASGKVKFTGSKEQLILTGAVMPENASMKIDYLQARFKINDSVRFDRNGFRFNNIRLTDEYGNPATLTGYVYHKNFKEYSADLSVNISSPTECLVLNTKPKDNDMFYGTAYVSGLTSIKSGPSSLSFDISARTGRGTKFSIPLSSELSVSDYSFITFVDSINKNNEDLAREGKKPVVIAEAPKQLGMDLNFDLVITPEAEVQIIFDSKVGDVMKGRGSGNLNMKLNKKGDFRMFGDYFIESGDYLFTLKNILNKSFSVENGGRITFNGDLDNAEIDIKAIYKLKTSLQPINPNQTDRVDVECQLNLTGKLFNPVVGLNIELPNADEQSKAYLRNAISSDEELSRQFLYLLITNSFLADANSGSAGSTSASGTAAMAVTTTEMLSNQLSNWLSQINNDLDIGLTWRPGTKDINSQELALALSTHVFDDMVTINSNLDYGSINGTANASNQLTGDFDAEVKLTEKLRFKVFNRFNNTYSGRGPYTQGIGIIFKEDFDKFSDLFRKKVKSEMKKEEDPTINNE